VARGKLRGPYIIMSEDLDSDGLKKFLKTRKDSLRAMQKGGDLPPVRIRADKDSQFKDIQHALIACRDIEIWQVRIATMKKSD
jgi:biopolymer transport protein ExbD